MDIQQYIQNAVVASRQKTLANSDQLTLGEMILKVEAIINSNDRENILVAYDFGYLFPTEIDSWRGSYSELALNYKSEGNYLTLKEFHKLLTDSLGKTFEGYKGGDFIMNKHTPVWVANYGDAGETAVIDIIDAGHKAVIMTGYREF